MGHAVLCFLKFQTAHPPTNTQTQTKSIKASVCNECPDQTGQYLKKKKQKTPWRSIMGRVEDKVQKFEYP